VPKALKLLILLGLIWGSGYSIARFAVLHGVTPLGYAFCQSLGPALFLLALCLKRKAPLPFQPKILIYFLVTGLLGVALPNTTMYITAAHLPAGLLAVVVNTVPLMMYPLARLFKLERFYWSRLFAVLLGFAGLMLMTLPGAHGVLGYHTAWIFIALISPLCFALCALFAAHFRPEKPSSLVLSMGMLMSSAILISPVLLTSQHFFEPHVAHGAGILAVIIEIILSSIGYILFFDVLDNAGPVFYSFVACVVSITGLIWGFIFFDETLNTISTTAVVLILIALYLVTRKINAYRANPRHDED